MSTKRKISPTRAAPGSLSVSFGRPQRVTAPPKKIRRLARAYDIQKVVANSHKRMHTATASLEQLFPAEEKPSKHARLQLDHHSVAVYSAHELNGLASNEQQMPSTLPSSGLSDAVCSSPSPFPNNIHAAPTNTDIRTSADKPAALSETTARREHLQPIKSLDLAELRSETKLKLKRPLVLPLSWNECNMDQFPLDSIR